ncbi:hypothetical protein BGZ79_007684 [Entomortierella chlamydospora]|nr:hypothetical protein BGZ79_007684 [Entomortierella chlamydospora]
MSNGETNAATQRGEQCRDSSPPHAPQRTSSSVATPMGHSPSSINATIFQEDSSPQQSTLSSQQPDIAATPVDTNESELPPDPDVMTKGESVQSQAPKQVFSLFLTPEQRKKKEAEAAAAAAAVTAATSSKRGRKAKSKGATNVVAIPATSTAPKPSIDPKTIVDPNISKTGETHPFFQEVKASQIQASASSAATAATSSSTSVRAATSTGGSKDGSGSKARSNGRRFNAKQQESPFPLSHQQFHGSETIEAINGVVARLCGLDTASSLLTILDSLQGKERKSLKKSPQSLSGWYNLRSTPDLGITAPQYKPRSRGKDSWTYWGNDRDQKWRRWSEKCHRLQRPSDMERQLLSQQSNQPKEFESCERVAANQQLWQKTWDSAILTSVGLTPGSADVPIDMKIGELWTEKYRPNRGADILGNRANTKYLTQWLSGLEVSGWTLNPEDNTSGGAKVAGLSKKPSEIMGAARKRRKRPRRRGAADLDDFVIYDDADDFEDPYGYLSEEEDGFFAAPRPLSTFSRLAHGDPTSEGETESYSGPRTLPETFDIKSNAILLSGRTGSCKTAAVYACAEESGYEVFEVSPGTRRTGKEVLGLVGEMAENHHVHVVPGKSESKDDLHNVISGRSQESSSTVSTPQPAPALASTPTIHSFFNPIQFKKYRDQEKAQKDEDVDMDESSDVDIEGDDDQESPASHRNDTPRSGTPSSSSPSSTKEEDKLSDLYSLLTTTNPRQSLILLEEVDILFEDDKGFWASIVTLLSKSRRPVVMTCNDTSKIPAATLRFQEHLEFERPGLWELHRYLSLICKIEGYICSSEYLLALIKHCRHDVRRCLMQLQYDSGVVRSKPQWSESSSANESSTLGTGVHVNGNSKPQVPQVTGSPARKKPQRLLRISAKGIIPASAPIVSKERKSIPTPLQELEQLEVQAQYAENMSLCDSGLRMKNHRVLQCYEADQSEASKDDDVGQHLPLYKRPTGADHLLLDQECGIHFEEGCESLYLHQANQQGLSHTFIFEEDIKRDDPARSVEENFVPLNEALSKNLQRMQPALEQMLSLHGLRFNVDTTFETYAPLIRSMIQAEEINTFVPSGKRTMRSGGHLRRHLNMLSDSERASMLSSSFPSPPEQP